MDKIAYTEEKMERVREQIQKIFEIASELERDFPGRHFTPDGHLVGSIGEVMAAYYYGIELYRASMGVHDGEVNGRKVQVKLTGQDDIVIAHEPEYLIVLYLRRDGTIYEVYNGKGDTPWKTASKLDVKNNRHMRLNRLLELDKLVLEEDRIVKVREIPKMSREYKNRKTPQSGKKPVCG